jgi:hypothetical protein
MPKTTSDNICSFRYVRIFHQSQFTYSEHCWKIDDVPFERRVVWGLLSPDTNQNEYPPTASSVDLQCQIVCKFVQEFGRYDFRPLGKHVVGVTRVGTLVMCSVLFPAPHTGALYMCFVL